MKFTTVAALALAGSAVASPLAPAPRAAKPLVESNKLRRIMYRSELKAKAQQLEALAYATPQRNRIIGSPGHNATINWIVDAIKKYPEYYTYSLQPFDLRLGVAGNLTLDGVKTEAYTTDLSAQGTAEGEVVVIKNLACDLVSCSWSRAKIVILTCE